MAVLLYAAVLTTGLLFLAYLHSPNIHSASWEDDKHIKHILLWTDPKLSPLDFLHNGFAAFTSNQCKYTNCYVSHNMSDLGAVVLFDVIVFNGRQLPKPNVLPRYRSPHQKYVYANMESPQNYPVSNSHFNGYFNWTWTYKLDSDLRWGYITAYDLTGQVVGPKKDMHWQEMDPIDEETKARLFAKSIAAAWFVSNCRTKSKRENFVKDLERKLHLHGLILHIYGKCGIHSCPRGISSECDKMLEEKYYFYFALENSVSEDYVTEKVLKALNHYTVPIVFGGANYSRFLPPGSYLDARELGAERLAAKMAAIIDNHLKGDGSLYHDFFRWRNHYKFKATAETEDVCKICELLNDPVAVLRTSVKNNFQEWWNGNTKCNTATHEKRIEENYIDSLF